MLVLGTYGAGETFFTLKGELEAIFTGLRLKKAEYTAVKDNPSYHPGRCAKVSIDGVDVGVMGQVHPLVGRELRHRRRRLLRRDRLHQAV